LAVVAAAVWLAAGCNETQTTFQGNTGATLSFLSPANAVAGSGGFILTVRGAPFTDKTVVQWNGSDRKTTFVNSSELTAEIKAADVANPGQATVNTFTPQTGAGQNGLSNTLIFKINPPPNPVPHITSISPDHATAGGPAFTLTITGSDFLLTSDPTGGSVVQWNAGASQFTSADGSGNITINSISATQITATISANLIASPGTAIVTVFNPPAPPPPSGGTGGGGGGTSPGGLTFTINSASLAAHSASASSPALSADGRYVAFVSDSGGHAQVFVRDTCAGGPNGCAAKTTLVSVNLAGRAAAGDSRAPSISADGRYVAFESEAKDLADSVPPGTQVFVRDTCAGAAADLPGQAGCQPSTQLVSIDDSGALSGNDNTSPVISASGRFVAFVSVTPARGASGASGQSASASQANSGLRQVFVRDTCLGAGDCAPKTTRVSLHPGDGSGESVPLKPAMSGSGKEFALPPPVANIFTRSVAIDDRVFLALVDSGPR
jgi:hypothetical protein